MAKLTGKELAERARQRREEKEEHLQREEDERLAEIEPLRRRLAYLRGQKGRRDQLKSVLDGLYDEMDKLSKKAPADQVTELALKRINDVIRRGKELMQGDEFIDSIEVFVAAGERPEHRDVLLVLRELRQGMQRLEAEESNLRFRASKEEWDVEEDDEKS